MRRHLAIDPRWRIAWIICAVLSLLAIGFCVIAQREASAVETERKAAEAAALQRFYAARDAMRKEQRERPFMVDGGTGRARMMNREELAARLFPEGAPQPRPGSSADQVIWDDPVRGVTWIVEFRADGTHSGVGFSPHRPPTISEPRLQALRLHLEPVRRLWVGSFTVLAIGPLLWATLLPATLIRNRLSRHAAHALLMVAWLCFLGWLLHPTSLISMPGIFSNDMLFWGAVMLFVSGLAVGVAFTRAAAVDPSRCVECSYDLTGNVSGTCPECGTAIIGHAPSAPVHH